MYYAGNLPARQPLLLLCGLVVLVEVIGLLCGLGSTWRGVWIIVELVEVIGLLCGLVELVEEIRLLLEPACPSTKELTDEQRIALMEKYQAIINQER